MNRRMSEKRGRVEVSMKEVITEENEGGKQGAVSVRKSAA